jgi:pyruvate/2-oxoglutarate dehydrogenase complex dihydrolipoamide acyltransferase (E2) component
MDWLCAAGDTVAAGDPLAIVVTERAEYLLPSPAVGVIEAMIAVGTVVRAGERIADLGGEQSALGIEDSEEPQLQLSGQPVEMERASADTQVCREMSAAALRVRATPLARRMATILGVDLDALAVSDRVRKQDVLRQAEARAHTTRQEIRDASPVPSRNHQPPVSPAPQMVTVFEVDLGAVHAYCAAHGATFQRIRLQLDPLVCVAHRAAGLLWQYPELNARWSEAGIVRRRRFDILVARGVQRFCVRDAGDLTLRGVARALARAHGDEVRDDVYFSIEQRATNAFLARPVSLAPSVQLWLSSEQPNVVVYHNGIRIRPLARMALAYDARLLDQQRADRFLASLCEQLEQFHIVG